MCTRSDRICNKLTRGNCHRNEGGGMGTVRMVGKSFKVASFISRYRQRCRAVQLLSSPQVTFVHFVCNVGCMMCVQLGVQLHIFATATETTLFNIESKFGKATNVYNIPSFCFKYVCSGHVWDILKGKLLWNFTDQAYVLLEWKV